MILQGTSKYPVSDVILHCAAIKTGQFSHMGPFQVFATVNRWHKERGFASFGYHGLFMPDGTFFSGRPFSQIGAHVIGHNRGTLGFLLIESREITHVGEFSDWFTPLQRLAVSAKIASIGGIQRVTGHNDYANKLCPGFHVKTADFLP